MKKTITLAVAIISLSSCCVTRYTDVYHSYHEFNSADEATAFCMAHPNEYIDGSLNVYRGSKVISVVPTSDGKLTYVVEMTNGKNEYKTSDHHKPQQVTTSDDSASPVVSSIDFKGGSFKLYLSLGMDDNGFPDIITETLQLDPDSAFEEVMEYVSTHYNVDRKISISKGMRTKYPQAPRTYIIEK